MTSDPSVELPPAKPDDPVEPSTVVEAMASAVVRVRRMATTVFEGDAQLFADTGGNCD